MVHASLASGQDSGLGAHFSLLPAGSCSEMAGLSLNHPWAFTFGILGNIISFLVYLSPLPTFYRVYKKKSTEGFHSVPYVVALFSATLWIFYALLKADAFLLVTINSVGCVIEAAYLAVFFFYAPRAAKISTAKLVLLVNVVLFGCILALILPFSEGYRRVQILGWICMIFSVCVFIAPLSIIRLVVRTKSVEFMPFWLSFFLTITAVVWFAYGLLTKDTYVALPNVLGFVFGVLQMVLYIAYKDGRQVVAEHGKLPEHIVSIGKVAGVAENIYPKPAAIKAENGDVGAVQKIGVGAEQVEMGTAAPQIGEEVIGREKGEVGIAASKRGEENV